MQLLLAGLFISSLPLPSLPKTPLPSKNGEPGSRRNWGQEIKLLGLAYQVVAINTTLHYVIMVLGSDMQEKLRGSGNVCWEL